MVTTDWRILPFTSLDRDAPCCFNLVITHHALFAVVLRGKHSTQPYPGLFIISQRTQHYSPGHPSILLICAGLWEAAANTDADIVSALVRMSLDFGPWEAVGLH